MLQYKNRNLAVIEAKARDKYYTEGVDQAKDYAGKLQVRFTDSTNGLQIYLIDMTEGQEGDVTSYPTPDELWEMIFPKSNEPNAELSEAWQDKLLSVPFEEDALVCTCPWLLLYLFLLEALYGALLTGRQKEKGKK